MAPTIESVSKHLEESATAGYDLSNKLYRVLQVLPSAVFEYGCFASQILYLGTNFEQINNILPTLDIPSDKLSLLEDLTKTLRFADDVYAEVKEALPQRPYDGAEVDLMLPMDASALEDQIEALQVGATLIMAVLQVAATRPISDSIVPTSNRFAEAIVNQLKKAIRDLKCSQPKDNKRRGTALKRAKTHAAIIDFLDLFLITVNPAAKADEAPTSSEEKQDGENQDHEKPSDVSAEEQDLVKLEHYGAHPTEDGMPEYVRHRPDAVYAKVHVNDVDLRSLTYYNLPYSKAKENPNYYIIWKSMEPWECDNLFQHTKKLRINEQHAAIDPKEVVRHLLEKWLGIKHDSPERNQGNDMEELEKNLEELRAQDEKRRPLDRRPIVHRDRSWSPSPPPRSRVPIPRRLPPYRHERFGQTSKTEYWRSWEGQTATLNTALTFAGWKPVYMRGTDDGQTWFYGENVLHVRRFTDDYTPQDVVGKEDMKPLEGKQFLIIGSEWIEEEAFHRHGFQYQLLSSGHYSVDPRMTWGDIEAVVYVSSTIREERLYRKFRASNNGDLAQVASLAIPDSDYINGATEVGSSAKAESITTTKRHFPHRLDSMPEEPVHRTGTKRHEILTPVESHDSFVEIFGVGATEWTSFPVVLLNFRKSAMYLDEFITASIDE